MSRTHQKSERRGALALAMVAALLAACNSDGLTGDLPDPSLAATPFLISNPGARPDHAAPVGAAGAAAGVATIAWVSLPPGSIPDADAVTIRERQTGAEVVTTVSDGGFDPVPIPARVGDTLELIVQRASAGAPSSYLALVPAATNPRVVRVSPPPHKRDVPLSAWVEVVFSEPMDSVSVVQAITLTRGGAPVAGTVLIPPQGGEILWATFVPTMPLAPSTSYETRVSTAAQDRDGEALGAAVSSDFVTDSSGTGTGADTTGTGADTAALVPVILSLAPGDTVPLDFATVRVVFQNSGANHFEVSFDDLPDAGMYAAVAQGWEWPPNVPVEAWLSFPDLAPGTHQLRVEAGDTLGHRGTAGPVSYTLVVPDSQPYIVVREFTLIEFSSYDGGPYYAPQLVVADTAGGAGLRIVGFQMLDLPGVYAPGPRAHAVGISVPPNQDIPLFWEIYGDWSLTFGDGVHRATGATARARLTYRDSSGHLYANTIEGPIVSGDLPTTYTGGPACQFWLPGPGSVQSLACPLP